MDWKFEILIIDDDADLTIDLKDILESEGYAAAVAHDGRTALTLCRERLFDLAIVDIKLPDIPGLELIKRLTEVSTKSVFAIITGHAAVESAIEAVKMGNIISYETKPLDMDRFLSLIRQVFERNRMAEKLRESELKYRTLFDSSPDAIMMLTPDEGFLSGNRAAIEIFGCKEEEELTSQSLSSLSPEQQPDAALSCVRVRQMMSLAMEKGSHSFEWKLKRMDGTEFWASVLLSRMELQGEQVFQATVRDVTGSKQAEEERSQLLEQLRQAQKMEAVGQLAGGVAHDFNNMMTVVLSYCDFLSEHLRQDDPLHEQVEEIRKAGKRAAGLTNQLLAFSRRQLLQPRALDLGALVANLEKMLRRLLAEDIEIAVVSEPELGWVEVDSGQMEQVIMNLAANARDAMPQGGKLTIEMGNLDLDEKYAQLHVGVRPGRYVLLAITDTGVGMAEDIRSRVFEPFFTTKEPGEGTGLGLSTVYGMVKQSGGNIWVYSEPGQGTTFKIYLPRVRKGAEPGGKIEAEASAGGSETVLVVEDEDMVRELVRLALQEKGYAILEARDGEEALKVAEQHQGPIHLFITDLVMPRMSGEELAEVLIRQHPQTRVLYMSGYAAGAVRHSRMLDKEVHFLPKPFTPDALRRKVREVLDSQAAEEHRDT